MPKKKKKEKKQKVKISVFQLINEVQSITESEWDHSLVTQAELPVMVMFTAQWCGPCRTMTPILNKMDSEYK